MHFNILVNFSKDNRIKSFETFDVSRSKVLIVDAIVSVYDDTKMSNNLHFLICVNFVSKNVKRYMEFS